MLDRDPTPGVFEEEIAATPSAVSRVRRELGQWLARSGVDGDPAHAILIATNEALANAVEHGSRDPEAPVRLRVRCADGAVRIEVTDAGSTVQPRPDPNRGRGLALMRALMDTVEVVLSSSGSTVRMERTIDAGGGLTPLHAE